MGLALQDWFSVAHDVLIGVHLQEHEARLDHQQFKACDFEVFVCHGSSSFSNLRGISVNVDDQADGRLDQTF